MAEAQQGKQKYEGWEPEAHEPHVDPFGCEDCDGTGMSNGHICKACGGLGDRS